MVREDAHTTEGFPYRRDQPEARVRLLCFPFSGGSAATYRDWPRALPSWIEVCAFEPPARGMRFNEAPLGSIASLLTRVETELAQLRELPIAIFGHSMGGRVAFALAKKLGTRAVHLFLSAARPPHEPPARIRSTLPPEELIAELRKIGGTPTEILDNPEFVALFERSIRADFALSEEPLDPHPLEIPITTFAGQGDALISVAKVSEWARYAQAIESYEIPGDHFFLVPQRDQVLEHIVRRLEKK